MTQCKQCEAELAADARFCSQCATPTSRIAGADVLRKAKTAACDAADDIIEGGAELATSDLGKKMAAGAAVGALVALPVPIVGWAAGAVVGAGLVAFRQISKKG